MRKICSSANVSCSDAFSVRAEARSVPNGFSMMIRDRSTRSGLAEHRARPRSAALRRDAEVVQPPAARHRAPPRRRRPRRPGPSGPVAAGRSASLPCERGPLLVGRRCGWRTRRTPCGRRSRNASSSRSSSEVPTMRHSGTSPASDRCSRPGSSLRRARSPVAPNSTITCGSQRRHQLGVDVVRFQADDIGLHVESGRGVDARCHGFVPGDGSGLASIRRPLDPGVRLGERVGCSPRVDHASVTGTGAPKRCQLDADLGGLLLDVFDHWLPAAAPDDEDRGRGSEGDADRDRGDELEPSVNAEAAWAARASPPGMRPAIASAAPIDSSAAARAPAGSADPAEVDPGSVGGVGDAAEEGDAERTAELSRGVVHGRPDARFRERHRGHDLAGRRRGRDGHAGTEQRERGRDDQVRACRATTCSARRARRR